MVLLRKLFLLTLVLLIAGCGGGGGGGSALINYNYVTDWTNQALTGGGLSQRVKLEKIDGTVLQSFVLNSPNRVVQFQNVTAGPYLLDVQLFTASALGGIQSGELKTVVTATSGGTFNSTVGDPANSVVVTPTSAEIPVGQTVQFFAHVVNGAGVATFNVPGTFTWTVLNGVATVDANGIALGTVAGNGSVRALHTPTQKLGAASLKVDTFTPTHSEWTLLVYMNAANDLDQFSDLNFNQMEVAAGNSNVRIVVQWKQAVINGESANPTFVGTRRYLVQHDTLSSYNSTLLQDMGTGVDMGQASTLNDFITWGKTNYPSNRVCLVIWDHGNGWRRAKRTMSTRGFSYDDDTGNHIDTWQLHQALASSTPLDIVAWDCSLMQMAEVAYEMKNDATLVVGSEESPPGEGYPYDTIFGDFASSPNAPTTTLARSFVNRTLAVPAYASRNITQSVIDTSQLANLASKVQAFSTQLQNNIGSLQAVIPGVRAAGQKYETDNRFFFDLFDVCQRIEASSNISALNTASADVRNAITSALVFEGHNANSPGSHGIAIDFSPGSFFTNVQADYNQLQWESATGWGNFLAVAP